MPTHNLFVSHSWRYGNQYDRLIELLRARPGFDFRDYSIPEDDPVHNARSDAQLQRAITNQMRPCGVVLVLAGVYATYSKWIDKEVDIAQGGFQRAKPIIAIRPPNNTNISARVRDAADEIVGWNTVSVVNAIERLV